MPRYAPERKEALLKKLLPPHNLSVARLAREEGISDATLYAWRKHAKAGGAAVPGNQKLTDQGRYIGSESSFYLPWVAPTPIRLLFGYRLVIG